MKLLVSLVSLALAGTAAAQNPSPAASATAAPDRHNIWRCDLPGGTYEVAVRAILAVSKHQYLVDGVARVTEVNVDTQGNMAVRFYFLEPVAAKSPVGVGQSALDRATDLTKEIAQRAGVDEIWKRVVKSYPTTTHAHTVEYRVESDAQLQQIFSSVQTAFETGRGTTLKLSPD